jgi:hypothetical protein
LRTVSHARAHPVAGGLVGLGLVACASCAGGELAGQPGLETALRSHYDARALERNGLCASPDLGVVTASRVEEQTQERLVVRVSYSYRDPDARLPAQCRGFGTRLFTVAKGAGGFEVLEMTGPRHEGIRINQIDDSEVW